jgi:hypothetical protein
MNQDQNPLEKRLLEIPSPHSRPDLSQLIPAYGMLKAIQDFRDDQPSYLGPERSFSILSLYVASQSAAMISAVLLAYSIASFAINNF